MATAMTTPESPGHSSAEEFEGGGEFIAAHYEQSSQPQSASKLAVPLQKRRRVTRACDECRRKKIKCDGRQPCTHCTVYSYDCTYDQPSNRRRNPAPQYIEALETRLQRAESLLKTVLPQIDLNDPNIDAIIQQRRQAGIAKDVGQSTYSLGPKTGESAAEQDAQLRSMIESTGQLDLDESGRWDFHGGSSGTVFVRRMREQLRDLLGGSYSQPFLPKLPRAMPLGPMYDYPGRSATESPLETGLPNTLDLPSKETAKRLVTNTLSCACALLRFVHQPTFNEMFDRIYDLPPEHFGDAENRFLPLLYVMLALGCMFHLEPSETESLPGNYKKSISLGLKYFRSARSMMDITDCRDITSLQTVLFMVLFLQSSANLSTCYSYIGIALRSSLRMGLHRNLAGNFNPIERETRRRVFWVVRKMDTYVSALLGFPLMLSDDDVDQELPLEVDDEYVTKDGVLPMPPGTTSLYAASNAHTKLMLILTKVIKLIYPTKELEKSVNVGSTSVAPYVISHAKIREIEKDLADWLDRLPMALRPGGDGTPEVLRVQQLLRLAYAHVQMMLYRPFLHYVSKKACAGKNVDERSYACAAAGVSVSRNIIHITTEMKKRGLLVGAFWFTMYTTFFAILSLVFFVLENPDKPGTQEILADAIDGRDALKGLAQQSQAADRCSIALETLFEQLPARLKNRPASVVSKKKRHAPSPTPRGSRSSPDLQSENVPSMGIARATTFPTPKSAKIAKISRTSLDDAHLQNITMSNSTSKQSFQDFRSPTEMSTVGTPDSSSTSNSMHHHQYNIPQYANNNGLPDFGTMMFPSADPFAYPNQPMMQYDNIKQENLGPLSAGMQIPPMYPSNNSGNNTPGIYDDLEGQLFGPLPPYLMQGHQQAFGNPNQMDVGMMQGQQPQNMSYDTGGQGNGDMNFEGIFSGDGEEWSNMLADQRYR